MQNSEKNSQLSENQIRELWQLCGFRKLPGASYRGKVLWLQPGETYQQGEPVGFDDKEPLYRLPRTDSQMGLPPSTLDNLFMLAVPLLTKWEMGNREDGVIYAIVSIKGERFPKEAIAEIPREALAQACLKALRARR